jgi:hypothetical protein
VDLESGAANFSPGFFVSINDAKSDFSLMTLADDKLADACVESNKNTIRNLIIMIVYVFLPSD